MAIGKWMLKKNNTWPLIPQSQLGAGGGVVVITGFGSAWATQEKEPPLLENGDEWNAIAMAT